LWKKMWKSHGFLKPHSGDASISTGARRAKAEDVPVFIDHFACLTPPPPAESGRPLGESAVDDQLMGK
jgi:hypothetical protein